MEASEIIKQLVDDHLADLGTTESRGGHPTIETNRRNEEDFCRLAFRTGLEAAAKVCDDKAKKHNDYWNANPNHCDPREAGEWDAYEEAATAIRAIAKDTK